MRLLGRQRYRSWRRHTGVGDVHGAGCVGGVYYGKRKHIGMTVYCIS